MQVRAQSRDVARDVARAADETHRQQDDEDACHVWPNGYSASYLTPHHNGTVPFASMRKELQRVVKQPHGDFHSVILNRNSNESGGTFVERSCFFESCMNVHHASDFSV